MTMIELELAELVPSFYQNPGLLVVGSLVMQTFCSQDLRKGNLSATYTPFDTQWYRA